MENESNGMLALVYAQPLSPQAFTHCRPSFSSGFSVEALMAPSAPAFTSAHLKLAGLWSVRTSLPLRGILVIAAASSPRTSTTSAVTPSGGVGPLHIPSDDGIF